MKHARQPRNPAFPPVSGDSPHDNQSPELLQRYLYEVGRRLPEKGREDILRELESDILERMETDNAEGKPASTHLTEVLTAFGDPEAICRQYGGRPAVLIGSDLFPSYVKVLRLVTTLVLTVLSFVFLISIVFSPTDTTGIAALIASWLSALFQGALSVFATVTLSFAIAERVMGKTGARQPEPETGWTPEKLPLLPDAANRIKPAGLITGMLFTLLGIGLLLFQRDIFGVIMRIPSQDKSVLIPLLNGPLVNSLLWIILPLMAVSLINAAMKLAAGRITVPTRILSAFLCFTGAIVTVVILNRADLLDPTRGLTSALGGMDAENLLTALRLSLRISSAAIAIPLVIEGVGHLRHLMGKALR